MNCLPAEISTGPSANGAPSMLMNGDVAKPSLIPNGMPNTVVPCGTERCPPSWSLNGHVPSLCDSPCTGYIIAVHRKMVSAPAAALCAAHLGGNVKKAKVFFNVHLIMSI